MADVGATLQDMTVNMANQEACMDPISALVQSSSLATFASYTIAAASRIRVETPLF